MLSVNFWNKLYLADGTEVFMRGTVYSLGGKRMEWTLDDPILYELTQVIVGGVNEDRHTETWNAAYAFVPHIIEKNLGAFVHVDYPYDDGARPH